MSTRSEMMRFIRADLKKKGMSTDGRIMIAKQDNQEKQILPLKTTQ